MSGVAVCAAVVIAVLPWLLALRARIGGVGALAVATLAVPAAVMALMFAAYATGAPLGWSVSVLGAVAAIAGWIWWARTRGARQGQVLTPLRDWWPVAVGATIAVGTFALGRILPGSPRVAWAMLGDSASQLVETRLMLTVGGIAPGPLNNPVPLSPALVAAVAAPGRPDSGPGAIFLHDLNAYALTWSALIVMSCLLAGVLGHAVVGRSTRLSGGWAKVAVATTSLLPLGWFWAGYPIKFGFINAHVVFVLLLASLLAYFAMVRRPGWGIVLQIVAVGLVVLAWGPLAIVPAALALAHAVSALGWFTTASVRARVAVVSAVVIGLVVALVVAIPVIAEARDSLRIPGGLAEFPKPMLPLAGALVIGLALALPQRFSRAGLGIVAVAVASMSGLLAVLVLAGQLTEPWTYYPHKYAWIATAFLLTIAFPLAWCVVATWSSAAWRGVGYAAGVLLVAVSLGLGSWWAPGDARLVGNNLPVLILVEDDLPDESQSPDAIADAVAERAGLDRLTIPWDSSLANDYRAAFWLIHLERERAAIAHEARAGDLWQLANFHGTAEDLCSLAQAAPQGLAVETTNDALSGDLQELCPAADIVVVLEAPAA